MSQGHVVCHLCNLKVGRWSNPKYLAARIQQMGTDRDGVAEGNGEAELVDVVACALSTPATSALSGIPRSLIVLGREDNANKKQENPRNHSRTQTVAPSVLFLDVKSPFTPKVT